MEGAVHLVRDWKRRCGRTFCWWNWRENSCWLRRKSGRADEDEQVNGALDHEAVTAAAIGRLACENG